ncbi:MAG: hypothetical protein QXX99_07090 [Candidatus Bathyarchaeia archaeon]
MRINIRVLAKIFGVIAAAVLSLILIYKTLVESAVLWNYGLLGIFLAALLSHLSIVARGFFLPALLSLTELYNPAVLGLIAGLGGALGEATAYYWGSGIRDALDDQKDDDLLPKLAERYGLLVMLLFASSPLPDTPIVLLAGSLRLSLWKVMAVQLVGKTILYVAGTYVGGLIFMELKSIFDYEATSIIFLVASLILCILISWRKSRNAILKILNKVIAVCSKVYGK